MKSGQELDRLIAEKIMGGVKRFLNGADITMRADGSGDVNPIYSEFIPPYSASLDEAWKVVEKLRSEGFNCYLEAPDSGKLYASFHRRNLTPANPEVARVRAETLPEAICRAALGIYGVEGFRCVDL